MYAIAPGGYANAARLSEPALKVDAGRKVPCHTVESNPTFNQLSYIPARFYLDPNMRTSIVQSASSRIIYPNSLKRGANTGIVRVAN